MDLALDILNLVGIVGAVVISAITLLSSRRLQTMQQHVSIMTTNRSDRIADMRKYSAKIISLSKAILNGVSIDESKDKLDLIKAVDSFNSLLQYIYPHDIELIDIAKDLENKLAYSSDLPDKASTDEEIINFWKLCDLYIGTEHERLKQEVNGEFQKTGETGKEAATFEDIYEKLKRQMK